MPPPRYPVYARAAEARKHLTANTRLQYTGTATGSGAYRIVPVPVVKKAAVVVAPAPRVLTLGQQAAQMVAPAFDPQIKYYNAEAARLRAEAETRRKNYADALMSANLANQQAAPNILEGYKQAVGQIQGIGSAATGAVGDAMRADAAKQAADLAQVGVALPAQDYATQQGVEYKRNVGIPGDTVATMGANENAYYMDRLANDRIHAVDAPQAQLQKTVDQINSDMASAVEKIQSGRPAAVADAIASIQKSRADVAAQEQRWRSDMAKLDFAYAKARMSATTASQKLQVDQWYKQQKLAGDAAKRQIDTAKADAYVNAQNATATLKGVQSAAGGYKPSSPSTKGWVTPTQPAPYQGLMANALGSMPKALLDTYTPDKSSAAFNWVWSRVSPYLLVRGKMKNAKGQTVPTTRAAVEKAAQAYLDRELKAMKAAAASGDVTKLNAIIAGLVAAGPKKP